MNLQLKLCNSLVMYVSIIQCSLHFVNFIVLLQQSILIWATMYKSKGSKSECSNYRGITLLSVPGKVFAKRVKCSTEVSKCCKSWMAEILPPLSNITQGCYAITRRTARRESALLRTPVSHMYEHVVRFKIIAHH